jgi:hypothetical protein
LVALSSVSRVAAVLAGLILVALVLGPFRTGLLDAPGSLRQRLFPRPAYVLPSQQQGPSGLVDGSPQQGWAARDGDPAAVVTFAQPVDLFKVGVLSGQSADGAGFRSSPRPRMVRLTAQSATGQTVSTAHELVDTPAFQSFSFSARKVKTIEIRVESTYGDTPGDIAYEMREIEFFRRG